MIRRLLVLACALAGSTGPLMARPSVSLTITSPPVAAAPPKGVPASDPALADREAAMKAHVLFLAADTMQGRKAGSHEYDIAADYVAAQFYAAGLAPAGDGGGYLQPVPLIAYRPGDKGKFVLTGADGRARTLVHGKDYLPGTDPEAITRKVDGALVFVGQGVVAPDYHRDDYAGADVRGKIVAILNSSPDTFDGEQRAHFASTATKVGIAAAHGAAGVILVQGPGQYFVSAGQRGYYEDERVTWGKGDGTGHGDSATTPMLGYLSSEATATLFTGAGQSFAAAVAAAEDHPADFRPVPLAARLSASIRTAMRPFRSMNVAGILPGSDPVVGAQVVILSAHLDHVGVGKPDEKGDTIYNGAMDNAVGIASLIEEAKRFKQSGVAPKRSILFLAVTAEEMGLVGSDYFANRPTVAKDRLVADVNLDMPMITYKFEDVIAFGADHSTLGPIVRRAAADAGVKFSPDPFPEQGFFVRSDHYRFVQQGIPAVFVWPGEAGPGKAASEAFLANHYHQPSDEVDNPEIDWESGVRFIDVNYQIARAIADAAERPRWNKGDFFGILYQGYGAK